MDATRLHRYAVTANTLLVYSTNDRNKALEVGISAINNIALITCVTVRDRLARRDISTLRRTNEPPHISNHD